MSLEILVIIAACITGAFLIWYGTSMAYKNYYGKIQHVKEYLEEENKKLRQEIEQLHEQFRGINPEQQDSH
jgi:uncharacterized protein YxeA